MLYGNAENCHCNGCELGGYNLILAPQNHRPHYHDQIESHNIHYFILNGLMGSSASVEFRLYILRKPFGRYFFWFTTVTLPGASFVDIFATLTLGKTTLSMVVKRAPWILFLTAAATLSTFLWTLSTRLISETFEIAPSYLIGSICSESLQLYIRYFHLFISEFNSMNPIINHKIIQSLI